MGLIEGELREREMVAEQWWAQALLEASCESGRW
jgi:hypothetical protein